MTAERARPVMLVGADSTAPFQVEVTDAHCVGRAPQRQSDRDRPAPRVCAFAQALGQAPAGVLPRLIRVSSSELDGFRSKWGRGYGHWVRDVLVWTKAPFLFRNELVVADGLDQQRPARPDEVKRLGDHPVVIRSA
jgi:hypothetical protein